MKYLLFIFSILLTTIGYGQQTANEEKYQAPEVQPTFKGGMKKFYKYISKNLEYPAEALENKVEGKVYVQFVVDTVGAILEESVMVAKSDNDLLNEEAIRLIRESPEWKPARLTKRGKPIMLRTLLPITFSLEKELGKKYRK